MAKKPRQSTIDAINKYTQRMLDKDKPTKSRGPNQQPEKEVEKSCLKWMRDRGWHVEIYEAKATWNTDAGRWLQQGMKAGTADCLGNTQEGIAVAIEFKAPGRLSTFNTTERTLQREFIINKIKTSAFACVTDSVERLAEIYNNWSLLSQEDRERGKEYLMSMLPKSFKTLEDDDPLFEE